MLLLLSLIACESLPCKDAEGPYLRVDWKQQQDPMADPASGFFSTIGEALAVARPGTTICVAEGVWTEQIILDRPGISLFGAGVDRTLLTAPTLWGQDDDGRGIVALSSTDLLLSDMTIEGGDVGVQVHPHAQATLSRLTLRGSGVGLLADDPLQLSASDLVLEGHSEVGALFTGEAALAVHLQRVDVRDNGDAALSEAGGIVSALPLRLDGVSFRRNAGVRATDLSAQGGLDATDLGVLGAPAAGGPPRLSVGGALRLSNATFETRGSTALAVDCAGRDAWVENLAVVSASGLWPADSVVLTDCSGQIAHATLAHVDGSDGDNGLVVRGYGDLSVSNTVIAGYQTALATQTWWGELRPEALFTGTIAQAGLLHATATGADLRPLTDSPLIDAGIALDVGADLEGRPRPQGAAPDVGAYERR